MRLSQDAALRQELRLKLSPQMLQSIKLMEMPLAELRERIAEEIEKNPALEIIRDKAEVPLYRSVTGRRGGLGNEHRRFIEGMLTRAETLQEHLLFQLRLQPVSPQVRKAGELIIQNLSGDGFHTASLEILLKDENQSDIQTALLLIQNLDPPGCATHDYRESLSVQARMMYGEAAKDIEALLPHLEELQRGKLSLAARALKLKESRVEELFLLIKKLSPFPGRQFAEGAESGARYVIPELRVARDTSSRESKHFNIILNNETIPVLGLSPFFLDTESSGIKRHEERDFIRENLKEARWFLDALNKRNRTLLRVARAIVCFQNEFFDKGPRFLAPLTLSKVAAELGIHETTVSRTANGKFMETEWGIYEIRRFFTNAVSSVNGDSESAYFSKAGVQEIMREIIKNEKRSLSDNEIVKLLAERGIKLARRTIAKYRAQLGLDSSYLR